MTVQRVDVRGSPGARRLRAQLLVSAQVTIPRLVSLSLMLGSVRTVQSLLGILSLPPSLPFPPPLSLKINLKKAKMWTACAAFPN